MIFIIGLVAAAYSSADSALTSLTTSFCFDILQLQKKKNKYPTNTRLYVHLGFTFLCFITIVIFYNTNDTSTIYKLFKWAGYTYGPLLGLFFFGIISKAQIKDGLIPIICILSPIICFVIDTNSNILLGGYQFGFELLLLNGIITYIGISIFSKQANTPNTP